MDLNDLNKPQLILLGVLLSFVTSIATGITTVTLMQQAPPEVVTPISKIVRQTVEKIQQVEGKTTVQTIIVKEEDLMVDAIAKNEPAIWTLSREITDELGNNIETSVGRAFVVVKDGTIAADANLAKDAGTYYVKNASGKFRADFISANKAGFSLLKIGFPLDDKSKLSVVVPAFGDLTNMKAGQKLILLGSTISSFIYEGGADLKLSSGKTNPGGMVINLDGQVLGIVLSGDNSFVSISAVTDALNAAKIQ